MLFQGFLHEGDHPVLVVAMPLRTSGPNRLVPCSVLQRSSGAAPRTYARCTCSMMKDACTAMLPRHVVAVVGQSMSTSNASARDRAGHGHTPSLFVERTCRAASPLFLPTGLCRSTLPRDIVLLGQDPTPKLDLPTIWPTLHETHRRSSTMSVQSWS